MIAIALDVNTLQTLDLSPVTMLIDQWHSTQTILEQENQIQFQINFPREETDPRELSEIPEVRLWFVRLDSVYPWFPFLLDWKAGELARYAAMLVPHQFHRTEGIQYNPEALEIFMMQKIFTLSDWLKVQGIPSNFRLKSLAQLLGYELEESFLNQI
ncbi:MAG: CRR6 family NdhI maturation factor [Woronichinia naegeliana WA131]|jgi:hypothetical protein|uniref:CRR6 family NdhI maturation factor n=1 Tax=Woronichinia naegeliana WA131 TaxID=2824559 RepID=A0A977KXU9_9CYAN|nr:MAG: CRR6 family NdhI maturation factor [Woronichinia naegeliana WA131]